MPVASCACPLPALHLRPDTLFMLGLTAMSVDLSDRRQLSFGAYRNRVKMPWLLKTSQVQ
jgi:hypothetical protein